MNYDLEFFSNPPLWILIIAAVVALILLLAILPAVGRWFRSRQTNKRIQKLDLRKITIKDIDQMEGSEFELYLHRLFQSIGYDDAYKTQDSGDFGADLVFTDRLDARNVLQAKRYQERKSIGLDAVQEVYSSMRYYQAARAIVLTSASGFTASCETLASVNGVKLLAREELIQIIQYFKTGKYEKAMDIIESEAYTQLTPWKDYLSRDKKNPKKDRKAEKQLYAR